MSNALEGRTYMKQKWVLDPDIVSGKKDSRHDHRYYDQDEYVIEKTPFDVPNGKWVMLQPLGCAWRKLVGADYSEVEQVTLHNLYGIYHVLFVSDKPFGFITANELEYVPGEQQPLPVGNRYVHVAQKIHRGELLPGIAIPSIEIARQAPDPSRKNGVYPHSEKGGLKRNRDQRRNHIRWARLTDVIAASGLSAEEVLLGFWPFIGSSYDYTNKQSGTMLHVVAADSAEFIKTGAPIVHFLHKEATREMMSEPIDDLWIRAGLAKAILHLLALGVKPEVMQPA